MRFEHFALNVSDARATAGWYVDHLGLTVLKRRDESPFTHFLGDSTGRVFFELYTNLTAEISDFASRHPLVFHFGFASVDADADARRLEAVGASVAARESLSDGSLLLMLRDPWGIPFQLCQRASVFP